MTCPDADNLAIVRQHPTRDPLPEGTLTDERLGKLVRLLTDNATVVVSGTKLADELGISRSEVWRLIEQLRDFGVEIQGHPATGYQLGAIPDLLVPESIGPLIQGTVFAGDIHHFFRVASTNIAAMQAGVAGEREGAVFLAEEQTAGKGRGGHTWHSAESDGIYCSVLLRPQLAPADVLVLALAAGVATAKAIQNVTGLKPDLRWPNDVLFGPRKFCGILTELNAEATRVRYVVIGIGINVNHSEFPEELREIATSLRLETGRTWSRVEITAALLRALDHEYKALVDSNADARRAIIRTFEDFSSYVRGRRVQVEEEGGYTGVTAGLDERGFLMIDTGERIRTVLSGTVRAVDDTAERIREFL